MIINATMFSNLNSSNNTVFLGADDCNNNKNILNKNQLQQMINNNSNIINQHKSNFSIENCSISTKVEDSVENKVKNGFNRVHSDQNLPSREMQNQIAICSGCNSKIQDKYVFNLMNTTWHGECLQCSQCGQILRESCFSKNGLLYCKEDYMKNFGTRCNSCFELIGQNEFVMRIEGPANSFNNRGARKLNYHLHCFKCLMCERRLQKGDEFILKNDGIYCKNELHLLKKTCGPMNSNLNVMNHQHPHHHPNNPNSSFSTSPSSCSSMSTTSIYSNIQSNQQYLQSSNLNENSLYNQPFNSNNNNQVVKNLSFQSEDSLETENELKKMRQVQHRPSKSSRRVTKRPRTILNAIQRYDFREAFKQSPKPCRKVREHLASKTGLSVRVVQVWFQNERAKMKKIQRRQQQQQLQNQQPNTKANKNTKRKKNSNNKEKPGLTNDSIEDNSSVLDDSDDQSGDDDDDEDNEDEDEIDEDDDVDESSDESQNEEDNDIESSELSKTIKKDNLNEPKFVENSIQQIVKNEPFSTSSTSSMFNNQEQITNNMIYSNYIAKADHSNLSQENLHFSLTSKFNQSSSTILDLDSQFLSQNLHQHQHQHQQQQQQQQQQLANPIERLFSMQSSYF